MVKTLKHWKERETTLTIGEQVYSGKVIFDFSQPECHYNSNNGNGQKAYYFEKKGGKRILISRETVTKGKEGGLILKVNKGVIFTK